MLGQQENRTTELNANTGVSWHGYRVHIAIKQIKHPLVAAKTLRTAPCACLGRQQKSYSWMKIQQRFMPKKDLFGEQFQDILPQRLTIS